MFINIIIFDSLFVQVCMSVSLNTVKPLLNDHPDERPSPLERPLHNVNLNIKCIDFYPLMRGHPF